MAGGCLCIVSEARQSAEHTDNLTILSLESRVLYPGVKSDAAARHTRGVDRWCDRWAMDHSVGAAHALRCGSLSERDSRAAVWIVDSPKPLDPGNRVPLSTHVQNVVAPGGCAGFASLARNFNGELSYVGTKRGHFTVEPR